MALCHYLQQQRATSSPVYDLVPETGKAKTIANFKLSNKKSAVKTFNLQNISYFATEQGKLFRNALCNSWKVIYKVGRPKNYSDFPLQLLTSSGEDDVRGTEKKHFSALKTPKSARAANLKFYIVITISILG